jgi:dTDP-4-dehydrorhamnose reductase
MKTRHQNTAIELWGGAECTVNRVRDQYFNQLDRSGHWGRETDLDRFAELGLRTLRFPLLWETLAPDSLERIDWSWADQRLTKLRALGIRPIVGMLHHGSGPRYTDLLDPLFPEKFSRFAREVAGRYPWIDAYAPINEPLTTARFSALYGHWYPHERSDASFARVILNESRATILAMEEIRKVNPNAILVQTEDLGRTFSSHAMKYQADFDNERRWLTWDLLNGAVQPGHRMWDHFSWLGVPSSEVEFFARNPCPPDIIGINYYATSERYLDENIENYPLELHGNNGRHVYADDAAVRARAIGLAGPRIIIAEAFKRYRLPIALTEVHLGCSVDEQMRWFMESWLAAETMRARGVDIRAVTAWALLGSFDWDSLVTRPHGHYESGAFALHGATVKRTALADLLAKLAAGEPVREAALVSPGWWRQRSRLRSTVRAKVAA